jgi:signal transduction histidine kinase
MGALVYIRLIGYTAGTLLQLFWMVVILGYRRQRNFERVFFFLCLALFLFYSGSLLALNAQLYYSQPPSHLTLIAWALLCIGLVFLPSLLLHLHIEYAETRELVRRPALKTIGLFASYLPLLYLAVHLYPVLIAQAGMDFAAPIYSLGGAFKIWLIASLLVCAFWQHRFSRVAPDVPQRFFHRMARGLLLTAAVWVFAVHSYRLFYGNPAIRAEWGASIALLPLLPLSALVYYVQKHNFLQIGRQRNLVYAVTVTFLALLYLSGIRRIGTWLEPVLPPEATAAILVFVLVVFFEPLQRLIARTLRATAQTEMDRAQRMTSAIQQVARLGDLAKLHSFIETWIKEQLQLADVQLVLADPEQPGAENSSDFEDREDAFPIREAGRLMGALRAKPHGAMLSGETRAALEFLCEQLPGALDLCRLIEEKLGLERELAERERLALVGQMAASISHNLKNPLGSIKTILQVQMENPELPESMRRETQMVLEEIGRLSTKLNQLLQFSRPAVLPEGRAVNCDAREVAREVVSVLRPDAQSKGVALELNPAATALNAAISTEALNDILTNLVVNALDAAPRGGHVQVRVSRKDGRGLLVVEDDGPGVPLELREKILQPFFTTKTQGTGLGLAIVTRRASDAGGKLEFESPLSNGRGTRFLIWLPLGAETL